ncbi:MAG TPA: D-amino-acid transaminase, partial [Rhizobiales bacterium]|nr:D-amino-acid transaminase [Hyphomicrobiales bacterium]
VAEEDAKISIFDRGYLFADGVYEVTAVIEGRMIDFDAHMERLVRSLGEIALKMPVSIEALRHIHKALMDKNNLTHGLIYMHITRGVADRNFTYPKNTDSAMILFTQQVDLLNPPALETGVKVATIPDIRWARRDIKSIALLPQAMGKQAAHEKGAYEGWMVEDGFVTEGTSSTAYIVKDGKIITRPLSHAVLAGVTRRTLLALAKEKGIETEQRPFTVEQALEADEAFMTSASTLVLPVVEIDGQKIGTGQPGPVTRLMRETYIKTALED